jgi:hypothetical protein
MNHVRRIHGISLAVFVGAIAIAGIRADQAVKPDSSQAAPAVPTFTKDVAPILFRNCTSCHRPGEIGPMPLLSYDDARPYAQAIAEEVEAGHMPPWHAEAPEGTFLNERRLSAREKDTLLRWARGGAPRGNPADMPAPPTYATGWRLGEPDRVFQMAKPYHVPAQGTIAYQYFQVPTDFTEPTFVKSIEVRPGARDVVHHVLLFYRAPAEPGRPASPLRFNPTLQRLPPPTLGENLPVRAPGTSTVLVATYAPGTDPQVMPDGTAVRLAPGGVFELQMHYTAVGKAADDQTKIGVTFSKDPSPREIRVSNFYNAQFTLPAGAADVEVIADVRFNVDTMVYGLFPHTHLRGKRWRYVLELPDGTTRPVLDVPHYHFHWQTYYMFSKPLRVPAGSRLVSHAWYDNSASNPANPDPKATVTWGDQTWDEMQYTGLLVAPAEARDRPGTARR